MGRTNTPLHSADDWKQKYRSSLEHLERSERQWAEVENLLRLAIRRLTLAADGVDPVLDHQLAEVRRVVRNTDENARLSSLLDEISLTVKGLEQGRSDEKHPTSVPEKALLRLFDSISWPPAVAKAAHALRAQLLATNQVEKLLPGFARLITDALAHDPATHDSSKADGKGGQAAPLADSQRCSSVPASTRQVLLEVLDHLDVPADQRSHVITLRKRIKGMKQAKDLSNLTAEVVVLMAPHRSGGIEETETARDGDDNVPRFQEILLQLLDYMGLPEDLSPCARKLEERLSGKLGNKDLAGVLQQIADLVSQLRSRVDKEKREIETFLVQLTNRLQDLGQHLQAAKSQQRASFDSTRELDEAVRSQVQDIESSVNKASNLEQLKKVVQTRFDSIRGDLDAYRRNGEQSHARMEREVEALTRRLRDMENECTELRERAQREHMQAVSDALTGVFNRSAYEARLTQEYARWKRYGTPFALMLWDVDGFKSINDTYGHSAGDNALKLIAGVLKDNLRDADFIARYGGDEFAALLSETDLHTALVVAEKIRQAVIDSHFHHRGTSVPVTLSCGVASVREGDTADVVFERADTALYRAKRDGKNQCESESG